MAEDSGNAFVTPAAPALTPLPPPWAVPTGAGLNTWERRLHRARDRGAAGPRPRPCEAGRHPLQAGLRPGPYEASRHPPAGWVTFQTW